MQKSNAKEVLTVIDKTLSEQTPREKQKMDTPKVLSMFFFIYYNQTLPKSLVSRYLLLEYLQLLRI